MNSGFLDQLLGNLTIFINTALPFLRPDAFYLFNTFIVLTIVFAGAWLAFGVPTHNVQFFIKKILLVGFFAFLVNNWLPVTDVIIRTFSFLGLKAAAAGGAPITTAQFFSPSSIVDMGSDLSKPMFAQVNTLSGFLEANALDMVIATLAAVVVIVSFIVIALQVMIALIEFKLVTLAGFILLPFALFSKTSFLTERLLGYVFSAGLKLFVLAVVVTFGFAVVPGWSVGVEPNVDEAVAVMAASMLMLGLALGAPSVASSLITGGPSLGVAAATGTAVGAGGLLAAGGLGAAGAIGMGRKGLGKASSSLPATRAAARMDNHAPLPGSQALRTAGRTPQLPGQNRARMAAAGRSLASAAPRGGDGGGGMSADLKGD